MAKIYVPENYINKPCVELYGHNVLRVYDSKPALNSESTYTDFYTDMDYYSKTGFASWGQWSSSLPVCIPSSNLVSDVYYRVDFPSILMTIFIFLILLFYFPYKIISRVFGRWLRV